MKHVIFSVCICLLVSSLAFAQQDKQYVVNAVTDYQQVPTIDGVAQSGEWSDAATPGCTGFVLHNDSSTAATEDPEVKAIFGQNYLYVLYQVTNADFSLDFDPDAGDPEDDGRDPSGTGFGGDDFEFFFFPDGADAASDATYYHTVFFPYQTDGICYIWDEAKADRSYSSPTTWDAADDKAEFSYDSGTLLLTIEYKISWDSFNYEGGIMTTYPEDGTEWGVQIGYINNNPSEAVNWEPDGQAGFLAGDADGKWTFTGTPDMPEVLSANPAWALYE